MNERLPKILALDDEKLILMTLRKSLADAYDVTECQTVEEALEVFRKSHFDLVITDIMMGQVDGFRFRTMIRSMNSDIPIIFLSSLMDDSGSPLLLRIMEDSYSYFLRKGATKKQLQAKIEQALSISRPQSELKSLQRRFDRNLALAAQVQQVMLPPWVQCTQEYEYCFTYKPLERVSGDLFEWIPIGDGSFVGVFGDLSGHGVQAALSMVAIETIIRPQLLQVKNVHSLKPNAILQELNRFFCTKFNGVTNMACLVSIWNFRQNTVIYQRAGLPDFTIIDSRTGKIRNPNPDDRANLTVGMSSDISYLESDNVVAHFTDDEVFLINTDGFDDMGTDEAPYGGLNMDIFHEILSTAVRAESILALPHRLLSAMAQLGFDHQIDDCFLWTLRKPAPADGPELCLAIPPDNVQADQAVIQASDFVRKRCQSDALATKTGLLLSECLANIIKHGSSNTALRSCDRIAVQLTDETDCVKITVFDRCVGWDASKLMESNQSDIDRLLADLNRKKSDSGRGIPIMRTLSPQIQNRLLDGVNETIFRISKAEPEPETT